ncbi:hypothetical protein VNO77_41838 [Canavalia gladiata]|uniref:Uncharacterized protein n=1 Tax=Canavalia gladiata TaxID=3824 RepID=A0AAN9K1P0_CANGL
MTMDSRKTGQSRVESGIAMMDLIFGIASRELGISWTTLHIVLTFDAQFTLYPGERTIRERCHLNWSFPEQSLSVFILTAIPPWPSPKDFLTRRIGPCRFEVAVTDQSNADCNLLSFTWIFNWAEQSGPRKISLVV